MYYLKRLIQLLWSTFLYLTAAVVILSAAIFGAARLLLPMLDNYNVEIEQQVGAFINQPVRIMSLDAEWKGLTPSLVLRNVRVLSKDKSKTLLQLTKAGIGLDLLNTALYQRIHFKEFFLSGVDVSLIRENDGSVGLSGFEFSQGEVTTAKGVEFLSDWLLGQGKISVQVKNLFFIDKKKGSKRYHFSNVHLQLFNRGNRHLVVGSVFLPIKEDHEFTFVVDISGNFLAGNDWFAKAHVSATNVSLMRLLGVNTTDDFSFAIGPSDFVMWAHWEKGELMKLQGEMALQDVRIGLAKDVKPILNSNFLADMDFDRSRGADAFKDKRVTQYERFTGRFVWRREADSWALKADRVSLSKNGWVWPNASLYMVSRQSRDDSREIEIRSSFLRVQDILPVLPVVLGSNHQLINLNNNINARADITYTHVLWNQADGRYEAMLDVDALHTNAWRHYPGFSRFAGEFFFTNNNGYIDFNTRDAQLNLPEVFRWDIELAAVNGRLNWTKHAESLALQGDDVYLDTKHIRTRNRFHMDIPQGGAPPFLTLISSFKEGDITYTSTYLPVNIMSKPLIHWLDRAFLQGRVTRGGAIIYGALNDFPFTKGNGVFDVRFDVADAMLDYSEDWPVVKNIDAHVIFKGDSLAITSDSGEIFTSKLSGVSAEIPSLSAVKVALNISGNIGGATQEKLDYLVQSPPLYKSFGKYLEGLKAKGESQLHLDLALSISKSHVSASTRGNLKMTDNSLSLPGLDNLLANIDGNIKIKDDAIETNALRALLVKQPVVIKIRKKTERGKKQPMESLIVTAKGRFNAQTISKQFLPVFSDLMSGRANWIVNLDIPLNNFSSARQRKVALSVESNLQGLETRLPDPLDKTAEKTVKLRVIGLFDDTDNTVWRVRYGDLMQGVFELEKKGGLYSVPRAELRYGTGPVKLPEGEGVRLVGSAQVVDIDVWRSLISQIEIHSTEKSKPLVGGRFPQHPLAGIDLTRYIHSIDLYVDKLFLYGQQADAVKLLVENKKHFLAAQLDSKDIKGVISIPNDLTKTPVDLNLEYWNLSSGEVGGQSVDPRVLPAVRAQSKSVKYGERFFGQVALETARTPDGLLLEQLIVKTDDTELRGDGTWMVQPNAQQHTQLAQFNFALNSANLGKTMQDMGFADTLKDGKGTINGKLQWLGSITNPELATLDGSMTINFTNGRLLELEPGGAGRAFGILSLQTLPRRLMLDFSDLFAKGLGFDKINGHFNIEHGDAFTNNFKLESPNATIEIKGRIGIAAQDYDQIVLVTPHIADITSLISLITSQPLLFFLQQIMKEDINKATSFEYALTGSWSNFQLEPVVKNITTDLETDEFKF